MVMKKMVLLAGVASLSLSLAACNQAPTDDAASEAPVVEEVAAPEAVVDPAADPAAAADAATAAAATDPAAAEATDGTDDNATAGGGIKPAAQ